MIYRTWGNPYTHSEYSRTTYQKKDLLYRLLPPELRWTRNGYGICYWCGNVKHTLYRYGDSPPIQLMGQKVKLYCNKDCYKACEL